MQMFIVSSEYCGSVAEGRGVTMMDVSSSLELQMEVHEIFTIMEKVPTRAFSSLGWKRLLPLLHLRIY